MVGRYDEARGEMAATPADSPEDAAELASLRQSTELLEHGTIDTTDWPREANLPPGTAVWAMAQVSIAFSDARDRFVRRDPTWAEPLHRARAQLGRAASMVMLRDTWIKLGGVFFVAALIAAIVVILLR